LFTGVATGRSVSTIRRHDKQTRNPGEGGKETKRSDQLQPTHDGAGDGQSQQSEDTRQQQQEALQIQGKTQHIQDETKQQKQHSGTELETKKQNVQRWNTGDDLGSRSGTKDASNHCLGWQTCISTLQKSISALEARLDTRMKTLYVRASERIADSERAHAQQIEELSRVIARQMEQVEDVIDAAGFSDTDSFFDNQAAGGQAGG
jgi:hypothetical protein